EQYDTSVRTNTLAGPGASDAAVVRIKESEKNGPRGTTMRGLALSTDCNGRWCQLNPKLGAMHAVAEAARNVAASGARPIAATNCLNFGSPEKPEVMWQFSQTIDGLGEACTALGTPITGGNVSFYNETLGKSIYPTPVIGILGILEDVSKVQKIAFQNEGDVIVFLDGSTTPLLGNQAEFSSSEYSKVAAGIVAGEPPAIDLSAEKRLQDCLVALAAAGAVNSVHDLGDGGLAVTLTQPCFSPMGAQQAAPPLGASVNIEGAGPAEYALFNECGARAIASVSSEKLAAVLATARQYSVGARRIGNVTRDNSLRIEYNGHVAVASGVPALREIWANSLEHMVVRS